MKSNAKICCQDKSTEGDKLKELRPTSKYLRQSSTVYITRHHRKTKIFIDKSLGSDIVC